MEGDQAYYSVQAYISHFNPLPPHGGRLSLYIVYHALGIFQSTPSAWRETHWICRSVSALFHFNPLPPHGGRRPSTVFPLSCPLRNFNPLPPHGGRLASRNLYSDTAQFQSTPSAWRETVPEIQKESEVKHFNPLPPHGGRQLVRFDPLNEEIISIHSLRMEGDVFPLAVIFEIADFNPLPPHGGRRHSQHIPIRGYNFNPLPPHGGRLQVPVPRTRTKSFQSTPSAWRET